MSFSSFDLRVTTSIQNWPAWVHPIMIFATFIGQPIMIGAVASVAAIVAWRQSQPRAAVALLGSFIALGLNGLVKLYLHRARPETLYVSNMKIHSYSFPSGHAFGSTVLYGLLAYFAFRHLPSPWNMVAGVALIVLIVSIGLSRIYLGAHYPTDVLGGWLFGLIILGLLIALVRP